MRILYDRFLSILKKGGLSYEKQLGKKAHVQEGTMTAFACDCISVCQSSAFCNCTSAATQSNTYAASMGKIVATALSGSNYMWG